MLKPQSYSHPLLANELQTAEILYWSASASQYNRLAETGLSKVQIPMPVRKKGQFKTSDTTMVDMVIMATVDMVIIATADMVIVAIHYRTLFQSRRKAGEKQNREKRTPRKSINASPDLLNNW